MNAIGSTAFFPCFFERSTNPRGEAAGLLYVLDATLLAALLLMAEWLRNPELPSTRHAIAPLVVPVKYIEQPAAVALPAGSRRRRMQHKPCAQRA